MGAPVSFTLEAMPLAAKLTLLDVLILSAVAIGAVFSFSPTPTKLLQLLLPVFAIGFPVLAWRVYVVSLLNPLIALPRSLVEGIIGGGIAGASFAVFTWASAAWGAGSRFDGFNTALQSDWVMLFQYILLNAAVFSIAGALIGVFVWFIHRTLGRYVFRF